MSDSPPFGQVECKFVHEESWEAISEHGGFITKSLFLQSVFRVHATRLFLVLTLCPIDVPVGLSYIIFVPRGTVTHFILRIITLNFYRLLKDNLSLFNRGATKQNHSCYQISHPGGSWSHVDFKKPRYITSWTWKHLSSNFCCLHLKNGKLKSGLIGSFIPTSSAWYVTDGELRMWTSGLQI